MAEDGRVSDTEVDDINKERVKHEVKENTGLRRGARNKVPNKQYATGAFLRHWDDEGTSEIEEGRG